MLRLCSLEIRGSTASHSILPFPAQFLFSFVSFSVFAASAVSLALFPHTPCLRLRVLFPLLHHHWWGPLLVSLRGTACPWPNQNVGKIRLCLFCVLAPAKATGCFYRRSAMQTKHHFPSPSPAFCLECVRKTLSSVLLLWNVHCSSIPCTMWDMCSP